VREQGYTFSIEQLRRLETDPNQPVGLSSLQAGRRLARLAAEAPLGVTITVNSRGVGGRLRCWVTVSGSDLQETRAGLRTLDDALRHTTMEVAGLLNSVARTGPITPIEAPPAPERVANAYLHVLPRGRREAVPFPGFSASDLEPASGMWASPTAADMGECARLLLRNPHLLLRQTVAPLSDQQAEDARTRMADHMHVEDVAAAVGTPVAVTTFLQADAAPWTLPVRFREHLRGWFDFIDLEETAGLPISHVVPELQAAGLLRFPVAHDFAFPGITVEPEEVPCQRVFIGTAGVRVGRARDLQDDEVDVVLDDETMSRHVHVIGESGSGKSTLLAALAAETAMRGEGLLLLDPHGTTVDRVLRELPPAARDRVLVIRCGDAANPVRLNPFAVDDLRSQDIVISDMLEAFQQLFDPAQQGIVGPRFQHTMKYALKTLVSFRGRRASLLDVPRLLYNRPLLDAAMAGLTDEETKQFWRNDILGNRSNDAQEVNAWIASKFTAFASNEAVRSVLATGEDSLDPAQAMTERRIVLVDLDKGSVGVMGARILGLLYLLRFWVAALNRPAPTPFTLLIDEASSFSSVTLPAILSEGRKFGLRAVVAHQYMSQLAGQLAEAINGSVATRLAFRVGTQDAVALAPSFLPEFGALDLSSMPQFTAAARVADSGYPTRPFTLVVDHNQRVRSDADADAISAMERRSRAELVDPYRDAQPLSIADLMPRVTPTRPQKPASFVDEWLAKRGDR
jgi:energy-coupling factor transporter ATP-binding protein EcfA2